MLQEVIRGATGRDVLGNWDLRLAMETHSDVTVYSVVWTEVCLIPRIWVIPSGFEALPMID